MNKKCKLITMLQSGDLSKSIFFQDLDQEMKFAIERGEKKVGKELDLIDATGEKFGDDDYGFEQKNELMGSWHLTKRNIQEKIEEQKRLYGKICSISLKKEYLYLFISKLIADNLSTEEKQELLSEQGTESEIIEVAEKKYLFYRVKTAIPQEFQKKNPEKDIELATWILNNLRCNALTAIIIANEWKSSGEFELVK